MRYNPDGSFRLFFKGFLYFLLQKATFSGPNCHQLTRVYCKDHYALAMDFVRNCHYGDKSNIAPPHSTNSLKNGTVTAEEEEPTTDLIDIDPSNVTLCHTYDDDDDSTIAEESTDSIITNSGSDATAPFDTNSHTHPGVTSTSAQEADALPIVVSVLSNHLTTSAIHS